MNYFNKENYIIKQIDYKTAMKMVVENHYLHRKAPCSFAYGMIDCNGDIVGVIVYGTPSSAPLRRGICGIEEKDNVIELTRLWIADHVGRNAESYLISQTIKLVNKDIIISYAEIDQGHLGIIYQATNWIYTGLSAKRTNWTVEGMDKHCQTIADKFTSQELKEKYGDKFTLVPRPRKHRYIFFKGGKKRRKYLMKQLKYKVEPYPKNIE